jgi:hypothetical protein
MVRTKILAGVALWAAIGSSSAQAVDDAGRRIVAGNGSQSCAVWTNDERYIDLKFQYDAWLSGYLFSFNRHNTIEFGLDILESTSNSAWSMWISNFCRSHPLDPIYEAADKLILELKSRAIRR